MSISLSSNVSCCCRKIHRRKIFFSLHPIVILWLAVAGTGDNRREWTGSRSAGDVRWGLQCRRNAAVAASAATVELYGRSPSCRPRRRTAARHRNLPTLSRFLDHPSANDVWRSRHGRQWKLRRRSSRYHAGLASGSAGCCLLCQSGRSSRSPNTRRCSVSVSSQRQRGL